MSDESGARTPRWFFTQWAVAELKKIKEVGITEDSMVKFLQAALVRLQGLQDSLNECVIAFNDAFYGAGISLRMEPWLNTSGKKIVYADVWPEGFEKEISAQI